MSSENRGERLKNRMRVLTERFVAQLPGRLDELRLLIDGVLYHPQDEDGRFKARMSAHKIAGAAGTFGFETLGTVCRAIESSIDRFEAERTGDSMRDELEALKGHLYRLSAEHLEPDVLEHLEEVPKSGGADSVSSEILQERILVLGNADSDQDDLLEQLRHFGLQASYLESLTDLENQLHPSELIILCADIQAMMPDFAGLSLSDLVEKQNGRFAWVAVSRIDDFPLRLAAVRHGASEFFTYPVDVPQLLDKVREIAGSLRPEPIHVLIVDDDIDQVSATAYTLQQAGMITSVASDPRQVFAIMVESKPELVITDMYMPECNGIELSRLIRQQEAFVGIPIIFLSVEEDSKRHIDAMSEGGDDFLVKPVRPEYLIAKVRMRAQRARDMRFFMEHDSLTGLLNHSHLKQRLEEELLRASRVGNELSFAMIDIDRFKSVNDTYGHLTGDRVLKSLSRMLQDRLRKTDTIGRYGGEEFGVILFNASLDVATRIMDDLREAFSQIVHHSANGDFQVTFSCGLSGYPELEDAKLIGDTADKALYRAKETGRNKVVRA